MNFKDLLKKLESASLFKDFKEQNPQAFLCAGFFILDFKDQRNQESLDFYSNNLIFTFVPQGEDFQLKEEEVFDKSKKLAEVNTNIKVEVDALKEIVERELKRLEVNKPLEKIIAVLQNSEGKTIWNLTCMCAGFSIIMIHLDAISKKVLKAEKKNLFDFVRPSK